MDTDKVKERMLIALKNSLGVVKDACEIADIARSTFYNWINEDPEFKSKVEAIKDESIDFVESQMFKRIKGYEHNEDKIFQYEGSPVIVPTKKHYPPSEQLIQFFLKTRGRERGYIEKQEINHKGDIRFNGIEIINPSE